MNAPSYLVAFYQGFERLHLDGPSVQAAPTDLASVPWLVAVFSHHDVLDGKYPVAIAASGTEAVQLALKRAQEIEGGTLPHMIRPGVWCTGNLIVSCEAAFRQSVEGALA